MRFFVVDGAVGESIEEFCRRISPRLIGSLTLQVNDRLVAEDLAQEVLARAWERWPSVSAMARPEVELPGFRGHGVVAGQAARSAA